MRAPIVLTLAGLTLGAPSGSAAAGPGAGAEAGAGTEAGAGVDTGAGTEAGAGSGAEAYRRLSQPPGRASRIVGTLALGQGLRFNNPYRLRTQLGDTGESLSLTSSYLDLGAAAAFGAANGLQHGAAVHLSIALAGVSQQSIAPTYLLAYRGPGRLLGYGRLGGAVLTAPDLNVGGELAGGLGYFMTGKLAFSGELVFNLFYGASTWEARYTVYPVLSAQLGVMVDHEILP